MIWLPFVSLSKFFIMAEIHDLGKKGEEIASAHLVSKGFKILATNWRIGNYELDIIAENDEMIVVAEVKTRSSTVFGEPEVFVTKSKQKNMIVAANSFVTYRNIEKEVRFDIIAIVFTGENYMINHIEDAFYPTL